MLTYTRARVWETVGKHDTGSKDSHKTVGSPSPKPSRVHSNIGHDQSQTVTPFISQNMSHTVKQYSIPITLFSFSCAGRLGSKETQRPAPQFFHQLSTQMMKNIEAQVTTRPRRAESHRRQPSPPRQQAKTPTNRVGTAPPKAPPSSHYPFLHRHMIVNS